MLLLGSSRNEIGKSGVTKYVCFLYEFSMGRMVLSSKNMLPSFIGIYAGNTDEATHTYHIYLLAQKMSHTSAMYITAVHTL